MKIDILIVDNDAFYRNGLNMALRRLEYINNIYEAESGEVALKYIRKIKPQIAFIEIGLPGMNGIETTRRALCLYHKIKIIALTLYSEAIYQTKMIEAGAAECILKDSGSHEIEAAIQSVLQNKSNRPHIIS